MADNKPTILVVDDESSIRESFSLILEKEFNILTAASGEAALKKVIDDKVDLVYLDMKMPGMSGLDTLKRIKEIDPSLEVIMVTAVNEVGIAGSAVKIGAKDYVLKPFDVHDILSRTRSIVIRSQTKPLRSFDKEELVGNSKHIEAARYALSEAMKNTDNVLITGEAGTESELIAGIAATTLEKDLVKLDITPHTSGSILLGSEKGSFINAFEKHSGILEEANNGLLFLRNIDLMPIELQALLKEAMKKKEFSREGSMSKIRLNVRIFASTSIDIKSVAEAFDKELLSLLSVNLIHLPPIRERQSDIPTLIGYFLDKANRELNKIIKMDESAFGALTSYIWPGNITEMSNTIMSLVLSSDKEISTEDLPYDIIMQNFASASQYISFDHIEGVLEKDHILNVMKKSGNSKVKAAKSLGVQMKALESKLESLNI
jgi:DNA-binding NtrC family response regulator